jgi:hypothetical protein
MMEVFRVVTVCLAWFVTERQRTHRAEVIRVAKGARPLESKMPFSPAVREGCAPGFKKTTPGFSDIGKRSFWYLRWRRGNFEMRFVSIDTA